MTISNILDAHGMGKGGITKQRFESFYFDTQRDLAQISANLNLDNRAPGARGKFYDLFFPGANDMSMSIGSRESYSGTTTAQATASAGNVTISVSTLTTPLMAGMEVTISSSAGTERKLIISLPNSSQITVASLNFTHPIGAFIYRSSNSFIWGTRTPAPNIYTGLFFNPMRGWYDNGTANVSFNRQQIGGYHLASGCINHSIGNTTNQPWLNMSNCTFGATNEFIVRTDNAIDLTNVAKISMTSTRGSNLVGYLSVHTTRDTSHTSSTAKVTWNISATKQTTVLDTSSITGNHFIRIHCLAFQDGSGDTAFQPSSRIFELWGEDSQGNIIGIPFSAPFVDYRMIVAPQFNMSELVLWVAKQQGTIEVAVATCAPGSNEIYTPLSLIRAEPTKMGWVEELFTHPIGNANRAVLRITVNRLSVINQVLGAVQ